MSTFEEAGEIIDRELEKLRQFFKTELKPATLRSAADALRATSSRLGRLAEEMEARLKTETSDKKP